MCVCVCVCMCVCVYVRVYVCSSNRSPYRIQCNSSSRDFVNIEHLYQRCVVMLSLPSVDLSGPTGEGLLPTYLPFSTTQVFDS